MLDHGTLNIPLSKRGNIDAQLDRHKAEQAIIARVEAKTNAARTKAERLTAKALVASVTDDLVARLATKHGKTASQVRKWLASEAHWNPALIIRALGAN